MRPRIGLAASFFLALLGATAQAEDAAGTWVGQLESGFKVRIKIASSAAGYTGSVTNPSGNVTPLDEVSSDGKQLHLGMRKLALSYDASWDEAQKIWVGKLVFQGVNTLNLRRAAAEDLAPVVRRRPQEEAIKSGPLPYTEHEVQFPNPAANISLAGTLSLPPGKGPFPAVVLVSGTGPNTRDEVIAGHAYFQVLADAIVRRGVAVLRFDKRGIGASTGNFGMATTADFASDAEAAFTYLKADARVQPQSVGMLGHSEGGIIAPMVAARHPGLAFVVMVAAPGVRGDRLFVMQAEATARAYGVPEAYIARRKRFDETLYAAVMAAESPDAARARAKELVAQGVADNVVDAVDARGLPNTLSAPWQRYFLAYDPGPALRAVRVPLLALNGALDTQVPLRENEAAVRAALKDNPQATIVVLPGANHLLQKAGTGAPNEYPDIDETIAPEALARIADWIAARK